MDTLDFDVDDNTFYTHKNHHTWRINMCQKQLTVNLLVNNTDKKLRKKIRFPSTPYRYVSALYSRYCIILFHPSICLLSVIRH